VVGRYVVDTSGLGFVTPFDKRLSTDIQIPRGDTLDAESGEMVTVEVTRWPTPTRGPAGRIVEVLGDIDDPGVDTEIILRKHDIPDEHGSEAIAEAKRIGGAVKPKDIAGRTDFRDRAVVTIDGEHARDFDDAISIEKLKDGHYWLGVHIADVAHYVQEGGAPRPGSLRARNVGVLPGARGAHVPVGTGHGPLQPQPARRSAGAIVPDGSDAARRRRPL
jgi:ribonuclease R